eukprot:686094-Rhodomonas_salina.1
MPRVAAIERIADRLGTICEVACTQTKSSQESRACHPELPSTHAAREGASSIRSRISALLILNILRGAASTALEGSMSLEFWAFTIAGKALVAILGFLQDFAEALLLVLSSEDRSEVTSEGYSNVPSEIRGREVVET